MFEFGDDDLVFIGKAPWCRKAVDNSIRSPRTPVIHLDGCTPLWDDATVYHVDTYLQNTLANLRTRSGVRNAYLIGELSQPRVGNSIDLDHSLLMTEHILKHQPIASAQYRKLEHMCQSVGLSPRSLLDAMRPFPVSGPLAGPRLSPECEANLHHAIAAVRPGRAQFTVYKPDFSVHSRNNRDITSFMSSVPLSVSISATLIVNTISDLPFHPVVLMPTVVEVAATAGIDCLALTGEDVLLIPEREICDLCTNHGISLYRARSSP